MKILEPEKVKREIVEMLYVKLWSTNKTVNYIKSTFGLKNSRAYELIREAKSDLASYYSKANIKPLENAIKKLETLQDRAIDSGDNKLYLEIQKELDKLLQLHVQKIEATIKQEQPLFSLDDLKSKDDKKKDE